MAEKNLRNRELTTEQRDKLEEFFNHIISNATVNYTYPEIQDIQTAMDTMLERIKTRVNSRGIFKIARIVRGGSMAEKTSLWKIEEYSNFHCLEFDFLAALENTVKHCIDRSANCRGCIKISKTPVDKERLRQCYDGVDILNVGLRKRYRRCDIFIAGALESQDVINDLFIKEINYCLSSSCDCLSFQCNEDENGYFKISFRPSSIEHKDGCGECTVIMSTGTLHVNIRWSVMQVNDGPNRCSLIFLWKSKANSLSAFDGQLLQKSQPLSSLPIFVDFLPALESLKPTPSGAGDEFDFFIVPKLCNVCGVDDGNDYVYRWRKSWCMAEINSFITNMSNKHRRCYQVMKYFSDMILFKGLPKYHIKTVALNHQVACSDTTDDCVDCVIGMLRELLQAYKTKELLSYQSNTNIIEGADFVELNKNNCERLIHGLCSVSATDTWKTFISQTIT